MHTETVSETTPPNFPAKFTLTQKVLASMLRENTGRALLDSGGAYGRNWERNALRPFWEAPATTITGHAYNGKLDLSVTHSVFHWLVDRLEYSRGMTRRLRALGKREDLYGMQLAERFPEYLRERGEAVGGIGEDPCTVNTYNGEDLLSQVLQFVYFTVGEGRGLRTEFVALQIHGGCDVRGGYTDPVVFEVTDDLAIFNNANASIWPDPGEVKIKQAKIDAQQPLPPGDIGEDLGDINWTTDDGCHWYFQGTSGSGYTDKQLDKLPAKAIEERSDWKKGTVCVLPDGSVLCPFSGCKLVAGY